MSVSDLNTFYELMFLRLAGCEEVREVVSSSISVFAATSILLPTIVFFNFRGSTLPTF